MLKQAHSLLVHKLSNHITQHGPNSIEAFVSLADILQAHIIEQDLLDDEDGDGLAELGARFHDAQAKRDDFGREEEVDDFAAVVFDQGADDSQGGETEVFEGAGFGGCVEEGVEEEGDVGWAGMSVRARGEGEWLRRIVDVPPRKRPRVSLCEATHCRSARALQTRFEAAAVSCEGLSSG